MLEIILLFVIGKNIASIAKKKNRNPVGYVLILVFGWFVLAFGFGIIGLVLAEGAGGNGDAAIFLILPGFLLGAACAVGLAYLVVGMVSPIKKSRRKSDYEDEYDDYDDQPRRRRDEDDDDDRPRRRRDEGDDRPRSRRRDEDDEYDRPRRRDDY
jgi:hypothetical protein